MTAENYRITSPTDEAYNCIAWALGIADQWWWPTDGKDWPEGIDREPTVAAFVAAFATVGYAPCSDASIEQGVEKIALYSQGAAPTHAARLLPSGRWTSKLGQHVDIEHATLDAIAGGLYGEPFLFFSRPATAQ